VTTKTLEEALVGLETRGDGTLPEARAAFDACAKGVREHLRESAKFLKESEKVGEKRQALEARIGVLRASLAAASESSSPALHSRVTAEEIERASRALLEHVEAAGRLVTLHLEGKKASLSQAKSRWSKANSVRGPRIVPVLEALSLAIPYRELDVSSALADVSDQQAKMAETLAALSRAKDALTAPARRVELDALLAELAVEHGAQNAPLLSPDPALFEAAQRVRDAWARSFRGVLIPLVQKALSSLSDDPKRGRGRPSSQLLRALAPLFPVAGCTLLSMRASFPLEARIIDRLVIDEAAQCAPVYAVPALARARRAMLTGDTAQLPPIYTLDPRADERVARGLSPASISEFRMDATSTTSAQRVAELHATGRLALTEHFRSQREIVALASRWSGYALDVRTPERSLAEVSTRLGSPVSIQAIVGRGERGPEGVVNEAEARAVVTLVEELLHDGVDASDIAVLTPFVGQCMRIERGLSGLAVSSSRGVLVSTVHRLQGGERRVVVFSVVATERRHLRWLAERPHLLHVATSRAQDHLVVFVSPEAARREPGLAPLLEGMRREG
jgi:hypothetical protein